MVPMARYEQRVDELVAARVDEPDNARRAWHEPCGSRASLHLQQPSATLRARSERTMQPWVRYGCTLVGQG